MFGGAMMVEGAHDILKSLKIVLRFSCPKRIPDRWGPHSHLPFQSYKLTTPSVFHWLVLLGLCFHPRACPHGPEYPTSSGSQVGYAHNPRDTPVSCHLGLPLSVLASVLSYLFPHPQKDQQTLGWLDPNPWHTERETEAQRGKELGQVSRG